MSSLPPSLKKTLTRSLLTAVVVLSRQSMASLQLLFWKVQLSSFLCEEDFQLYGFHRCQHAVWLDNKQRGVRGREVIKTCSHIIIPMASPCLSFFSSKVSPFSSPSPSQMKGLSRAARWMKMMEKLIKKKEGKRWKVVLKWFATLVVSPLLTFQFKQTIYWLWDTPSLGIHGGGRAARRKKKR